MFITYVLDLGCDFVESYSKILGMKILRYLKNLFLRLFQRRFETHYVYVAMGDSTVEGVGASSSDKTFPALVRDFIKSGYKNISFYNLGKRGALVKDLLKYQLDEAITLRPNLVSISIGANNVMRGGRISTFEKDLRLLFERLGRETSSTIVINNIPDFSAAKKIIKPVRVFYAFRARKFNEVIEKLSDEYKVIHVDLYNNSRFVFNNYPEFVSSDGLHPSDLGYALWANIIINRLNFFLQR